MFRVIVKLGWVDKILVIHASKISEIVPRFCINLNVSNLLCDVEILLAYYFIHHEPIHAGQ